MGKKPIFLPSLVLKHFQLWIVLPFLNPFVLLLMSYITYIHTYHIHIVYIYIYLHIPQISWLALFFSALAKKIRAKQTPLQAAGVFAPSRSLAGSELANQAFQLLQRIRSRTRSRVKKRPLGRTHSFGIDPSALGKSYETRGV